MGKGIHLEFEISTADFSAVHKNQQNKELELNAPDFSGTQKYGNNNTREIFNIDEER